jgi:V/A-type H+-transporting ATPase subunit E
MQNKLQELTEKLYSEGLSKGRKDAEEMKKKAKADADDIISKANEEYKNILAKAQKDAEDYKIKVLNEIKMASKQSMHSLKSEIENLLFLKAVQAPVNAALSETDFLKKILLAAVSAFSPENSSNNTLEVLLPSSLKNELDSFIKNEVQKNLKGEILITFDQKLTNGFKIGPKESGYFISFTDADFRELVGEYLRPKTRELLFSAE